MKLVCMRCWDGWPGLNLKICVQGSDMRELYTQGIEEVWYKKWAFSQPHSLSLSLSLSLSPSHPPSPYAIPLSCSAWWRRVPVGELGEAARARRWRWPDGVGSRQSWSSSTTSSSSYSSPSNHHLPLPLLLPCRVQSVSRGGTQCRLVEGWGSRGRCNRSSTGWNSTGQGERVCAGERKKGGGCKLLL